MATPNPTNRIWLTYKTRMVTEKRFKRYALISHLAMSWYAFLSIVFSIYQDRFALALGVDGANKAALVISVLTFGLSLIIYGFKYEDSANVFRECYLKMQSIYQSTDLDDVKSKNYLSVLDQFPNHSDRDWKEMIFENWRAGRKVTGTDGNDIVLNWRAITIGYGHYGIRYGIIAAIFLMPLALGYWSLQPQAPSMPTAAEHSPVNSINVSTKGGT